MKKLKGKKWKIIFYKENKKFPIFPLSKNIISQNFIIINIINKFYYVSGKKPAIYFK